MKTVILVFAPDGTIRHLVDPVSEVIGESAGSKVATRRASHVETISSLSEAALQQIAYLLPANGALSVEQRNWFWADLLPVNGPVLGPFVHYADAVEAEINWLNEHNIPDI